MTICRSLAICALGSILVPLFPSTAFGSAEPAASHSSPLIQKGGIDCKTLNSQADNICPRTIRAPDIELEPVPPFKEAKWDYGQHRYSIVFLLSSWNKRSEEIARLIKPKMAEFKRRHVNVLGYASHDTMTELQKWQDVVRPEFPLGLAPISIIEKLNNPKLPTLWVASSTGQIITRLSLPSDEEIQALLDKLLLWTEF